MGNTRIISNKNLKLENTYISLPNIFYSKQYPHEVPCPKIIMFNDSLTDELGLDSEFLQSSEGIDFLSGNKVLQDSVPIAQAYAGHQFGHFTMLGDGRAILLGEYLSKSGERFDIQLKGSGITPYSRGGDGKASLGPMLREYIISEAMNALGIKTTRSLAVTKTGEYIMREDKLQGAVLTRISSSHIRVGTFQFAANFGGTEDVKALADYTLKNYLNKDYDKNNKYLFLLKEVIKRQAELIAKWQLVGFIHGVMNTDNMSITGETIDYGPCAFMDEYDPNTVFSSIDTNGRYAYGNQPKIGAWNLARFAETLIPLLSENLDEAVRIGENALEDFSKLYYANWYEGMRKKIGLFNEEEQDKDLIISLLDIMKDENEDYTNTFYYLTTGEVEKLNMFKSNKYKSWYKLWCDRLKRQDNSKEDIKKLMEKSNPTLIPRNHRVEEALEAAVRGDYNVINSLLDAVSNPYDYNKVDEYYINPPEIKNCQYRTYCGT